MVTRFILSFISTWALMNITQVNAGDIFSLVFFVMLFCLYEYTTKRIKADTTMATPYSKRIALGFSVLFTLFYLIVKYKALIATVSHKILIPVILTITALGLIIIFFYLIMLLFSFVACPDSKLTILSETDAPTKPIISFYQKHMGVCTFFICLIGWLPIFLYEYPAIMSPDSMSQFEQAIGLIPYSNHHPVVNTLLIKLFYNIGLLFTDNPVIAISFYTVFQMCVMAFSVAYLVKTLTLFKVKAFVCLIITFSYSLITYHAFHAVTIWKDVMFAIIVMTFTCSLLRFKKGIKISNIVTFFALGVLLCLFRSNGWYGFIVCIPFLIYHFRKKWKVMLPVILGMFLTVVIIKYPIMNAAKVTQPDFVESLSIPIQQIANVIALDKELTPEESVLINKIMDTSRVKEIYLPYISDNMKWLVRTGDPVYLEEHKADYLKLWIGLGLKYPGVYIDAHVNQTSGYFYPGKTYPVIIAEKIVTNENGLHSSPIIDGFLVSKTKSLLVKLGSFIPLYSLLWNTAAIFWGYLLCLAIVLVKKEKQKLIYFLPGLALYLTIIIATPVANEFRYLYFMTFTMPLYIVIPYIKLDNTDT